MISSFPVKDLQLKVKGDGRGRYPFITISPTGLAMQEEKREASTFYLMNDFTIKSKDEKQIICGEYLKLTEVVLKTIENMQRKIATIIKA